jgi:hypothetical protein
LGYIAIGLFINNLVGLPIYPYSFPVVIVCTWMVWCILQVLNQVHYTCYNTIGLHLLYNLLNLFLIFSASGKVGKQLLTSKCTCDMQLQNQIPSTIFSIISHILGDLSKEVVWNRDNIKEPAIINKQLAPFKH